MPTAIVFALILLVPNHATAQAHDVSQRSSPRFQLSGDLGVTAAFAENVVVAATSLDFRIYAPEGAGVLVRVGYEGLLYLNFGAIDVAAAYRIEVPGGDWAGLGLGIAVGASAMVRDSVYHFTGDDIALGLFAMGGLDLRLGSLIVGLDALGRWQLAAFPLLGGETRQLGWAEVGAVFRIGGEVLL